MNIHLLGIAGTGMTSLAGLFVEAGYRVTGTDEGIYPPMSDQLASLGIEPFEGYDAQNIDKASPDLVIVGNVIRKENPEAQEVLKRSIPYHSMPEALATFFLKNRTPLVIAGTHGKTTCSTLASWLLKSCKIDPGFLVGGVGLNLGKSYALGKDVQFVIEGDEYDTAFFDKGPKFLHYNPQGLLLTSIEFDHADIYKNLDHIMDSFKRLTATVPPDGLIVANSDDRNVLAAIGTAPCRVVTYGFNKEAHYHPESIEVGEAGTTFKLSNVEESFTMPLWGEHNLLNAIGVIALLLESGLDANDIAGGLLEFKGVRRRQECIYDDKGVTIIDDFAHHPTAVGKTIESMRLRFPGRTVWAIFEPRSNTSRRNFFAEEFRSALSKADRVMIATPFKEELIPRDERLDVRAIADDILKNGTDAHAVDGSDHIVEFIMRGIEYGDVILVMSNGAFDGINAKLISAMERRRIFSDKSAITSGKVPR